MSCLKREASCGRGLQEVDTFVFKKFGLKFTRPIFSQKNGMIRRVFLQHLAQADDAQFAQDLDFSYEEGQLGCGPSSPGLKRMGSSQILKSRCKKLLGAPGLITRSKDATRGSWPYY